MATYADTKVMRALFARVGTLTFSPALPIAWPNKEFSPPAGNAWLRVNELPAGTQPFGLPGDPTDRTGLMQIDVFRPLGEGHVTAKEVAGQIAAHFPAGRRLTSEGVSVKVTRAELGPVIRDDTRIMLPVTIYWRAFT